MWLANRLRRFTIGYLQFLLCVAALLIFLGYLRMWWQSVERSPLDLFLFFVLCGLASLAAYFIRESGKPRRDRHEGRRGAERTPLLPQDGGTNVDA